MSLAVTLLSHIPSGGKQDQPQRPPWNEPVVATSAPQNFNLRRTGSILIGHLNQLADRQLANELFWTARSSISTLLSSALILKVILYVQFGPLGRQVEQMTTDAG